MKRHDERETGLALRTHRRGLRIISDDVSLDVF